MMTPPMRRSLLATLSIIGLLSGSACSQPAAAPAPAPQPEQAFIDQANALADDHQASLQKALMEAMGQVGPVGAIGVCQSTAPAIAAQLSEISGLQVSRIASRNRNPGNAVPAELAELYRELEAQPMSNGKPRFLAARVADRDVFLRAIPMQDQPCAACHGTAIAPEVTNAIAAAYPQDKATGYAAGELRGAFLVSRPAQ